MALWRLRRATTMETGLFEIQADGGLTQAFDADPASHGSAYETEDVPGQRCFLRLANLPNYALDRLSRHEAILWRQAG